MINQVEISGEDVHQRAYRWAWWSGLDLLGDALVLALEMQSLDADVVAVLDVMIDTSDERAPAVALLVLFGPATADKDDAWRQAFYASEAEPRFRRLLAGDTAADGFEYLGPGHWQLHLLEP